MLWQFAIVDKQGGAPRDLDKAKGVDFPDLIRPNNLSHLRRGHVPKLSRNTG